MTLQAHQNSVYTKNGISSRWNPQTPSEVGWHPLKISLVAYCPSVWLSAKQMKQREALTRPSRQKGQALDL